MANEIYICRHGETEWSASGQHTSHTDLPLIEAGESAARKLGERLGSLTFDLILTSPLKRATDTCRIAGFDGETEPALTEWDYGDYEGLTTPEIQKTVPDWNLFTHGVPNGETAAQIEARVDALLARLDQIPGRVLLFSSGHISRALGARWIGLTANDARHLSLSTASLSILGYIRQDRALLLWNDTSHLI
jgi:broad specificity phosphatase PhoE